MVITVYYLLVLNQLLKAIAQGREDMGPESSAWFYFLLRSPGQLGPPFGTFTKRIKGQEPAWSWPCGGSELVLAVTSIPGLVTDRTIAGRGQPSWDTGKGVHRPGPLALHQHSQGILSPSGSQPTPSAAGPLPALSATLQ